MSDTAPGAVESVHYALDPEMTEADWSAWAAFCDRFADRSRESKIRPVEGGDVR